MKKLSLSLSLIALIAFVSCKENKSEEKIIEQESVEVEEKGASSRVSFTLESKSGSNATGNVVFEETDGIVKLEVNLSGLTPGKHAIHIHEKSDCTSPDGKSAGGHWNPTKVKHGRWGDSQGFHKGDIGNIVVSDNGEGSVSMQTDEWCIGCGDETKDILGKAIIVHEGVDDFTTQPTGNAGGRVSCGGIIQ